MRNATKNQPAWLDEYEGEPEGDLVVFTPYAPRAWGPPPGGDDRVILHVTVEDRRKFRELEDFGFPVVVADQLTGRRFGIMRADCGAGCRCAAQIVFEVSADSPR